MMEMAQNRLGAQAVAPAINAAQEQYMAQQQETPQRNKLWLNYTE